MTWINTFRTQYKPLLDQGVSGAKRGLVEGIYQRGTGFDMMFSTLLSRNQSSYEIVETGTLRRPDQWKDGQSARLFTEFVDAYGGRVRSVDIDPEACKISIANVVSDNFHVYCKDSVEWLGQLGDLESVDLFYLDSWDVKWQNDRPSAAHHLAEFKAIEHKLKPGCIVAIDDNSRFLADNQRTGKGRMIVEYLETKNRHPIYDHYQIIYQF